MGRKRIVVGVDASPEAAGAAWFGHHLAQRAGARCVLVHAVRDVWTAFPGVELPVSLEEISRALEVQAREQVAAALTGSVPQTAIDGLIVQVGRAAVVLPEVAAREGAELIVLGGKHHSALGRWMGGSTSLNVVRTAKVPVLVTAKPRPEITRMMVAAELSPAAKPTIAAAERYAALFDARLRAISVLEPLPIIAEVPPVDPAPYYRLSEDLLERDVWPLVTRPGSDRIVRYGAVVDTLLRESAEWRADLLVLGSHGRNWAKRILLGSVTERVLNDLPTSVLVVPVGVAADLVVEKQPPVRQAVLRLKKTFRSR